jgi:peptide deformylase
MIRKISKLTDEVAEPISPTQNTKELYSLIDDLEAYLDKHSDWTFLAGPMVGINKNIVIFKRNDGYQVFLNVMPVFDKYDKVLFVETNPILENEGKLQEYIIWRPEKIRIYYQRLDGMAMETELLDPKEASTMQQCIQIMNGIWLNDVAFPVNDFEHKSKEEQLTILSEYQEQMSLLKDKLAKEENPVRDILNKRKEFTEALATGRIEFPKNRAQRRAEEKQRKALKKFGIDLNQD